MKWEELSCGACGVAEVRLRGRKSSSGGHGAYDDLALVCVGCGTVTHVVPPRVYVELMWGREKEGEKADGVLCAMDWPINKEKK